MKHAKDAKHKHPSVKAKQQKKNAMKYNRKKNYKKNILETEGLHLTV